MFKIEVAPEGYQLVGPGGEESGVTNYGDTAEIEVEGKVYEAVVESQQDALNEPPQVYLCLDEDPVVEVVEFDLEDEEEDEEEGEETAPDAA